MNKKIIRLIIIILAIYIIIVVVALLTNKQAVKSDVSKMPNKPIVSKAVTEKPVIPEAEPDLGARMSEGKVFLQ